MKTEIKIVFFLVSMMVSAGTLLAGEFVKGPWLQNVKTDGIVVMWEDSEEESSTPTVEYGLTASCELGSVDAAHASVSGYHVYSAAITGLGADTIYHYRVTLGATQSADATFKTAVEKGTSGFRFYVAGDNRSNPGTWGAIAGQIHADMIEYPEHHQTFILNSGDIVADGSEYGDWDQLWPPAQVMAAELPIYVGFGNHEDRNTASSDAFLYGYFDFPCVESGSPDEKWYSFDFGDVHVTAIPLWDDDSYRSGTMHDWIVSDLGSAQGDGRIDWTFVNMHFLPWSLGHHDESEAANLRTYLHPVFRDGGVLCALGGHNHLYCRYAPVEGVTYITSGGAGAGLSSGTYDPWSGAVLEAVAQVHQYCIVDVEADVVALRALDVNGERLDYVTFGGTDSNRPPFADAGPDIEGTVGETVALDGTASEDPERSGLSYEWMQITGPGVAFSGGDTATPLFVPSVGSRYLFRLRVSDGSTWSAPDFCVVRVSAGSLTFMPEADTYVNADSPSTNYGSEDVLMLDLGDSSNPNETQHVYLRFNVDGIDGPVQSATFRMYVVNEGDAGEIYTSSDVGWPENEPTWDSPIPQDGPMVGIINAPAVYAWGEADVTDGVTGNGLVTFIIVPAGSNGSDFHSRENANKPELIVTYTDEVEIDIPPELLEDGEDIVSDPGVDADIDGAVDMTGDGAGEDTGCGCMLAR